MAQFKRIKKNINGILLLDKPLGISSNQALQKAKWQYHAAKAGHTGSLDPLASGLLPICFGEATKFSHYLLDADKTYEASIRLGTITSTGDAEGEVIASKEFDVTDEQVDEILKSFLGEIEQVPPMYSALKHKGKALYEYARKGMEIERESRKVKIFSLIKRNFKNGLLEVSVSCSKGTYIRTLAEDIGNKLGCGAHLASLRRTKTAHFSLNDAVTLEQLENMPEMDLQAILLPVDSSIVKLPTIVINDKCKFLFQRGQEIDYSGLVTDEKVRIYSENGDFLGLGEHTSNGKIVPKRLIMQKD